MIELVDRRVFGAIEFIDDLSETRVLSPLQIHAPGVQVASTDAHGLPPLQVEAAAFAWLAAKTMKRETGSLESVTGARGARVLGAIYPR